jgi:uncharacterized membrane protein YbhN (UPF0104 family)
VSSAQFRSLLRAVISCALVGLLLSRVHWIELKSILLAVRPGYLLAGSILVPLSIGLLAWRTRLLLTQGGIVLPYRPVLFMTWAGQFYNAFLPGSTGGDAVKAYAICRAAPDAKAAGIAAIFLDRLAALAALLLLAAGTICLEPRLLVQLVRGNAATFQIPPLGWGLVLIGLFSLLAIISLGWLGLHWLRAQPAESRVGLLLSALVTGSRPSRRLGLALAVAIVVHLCNVLSMFLLARALQIPITPGQALFAMPLTLVVTLLPVTINGHGLRECVLVFCFQHWQLTSAADPAAGVFASVVAFSLLSVSNEMLWNLPGGFLRLGAGRRSTRELDPAWRPNPACVP